MDRVVQTLVVVAAVVGTSAALFVGTNMFFDQATRRWRLFGALATAGVAAAAFGLLWGNGLLERPVVAAVLAVPLAAGVGAAMAGSTDRGRRMLVGAVGWGVIGLVGGMSLVAGARPNLWYLNIAPALAATLAAGGLVWVVRGRRRHELASQALFVACVGWLVGAFLLARLGSGTPLEAAGAGAVLGVGAGAWLGSLRVTDPSSAHRIASKARVVIFIGPALALVAVTLVIPLVRTVWLGFLTGGPREFTFAGLDNYVAMFSDPGVIDVSGWVRVFGSRLFWTAVLLAGVGAVIGLLAGRRTGQRFAGVGGSLVPLSVAAVLAAFAVFTTIRGTVSNNVWWVFTVTLFCSALGLAIAVLADGARGEKLAKSLIFLPMAISFVGASIIWRFMYVARPAQDDQTGVLNALWVQLGKLSTSTMPKQIALAAIGAALAGMAYVAWRGYRDRNAGMTGGAVLVILALGWLGYRLAGPGIGGFIITEVGQTVPDTVLFLQEPPFNNLWMMVVLIWIQTGFAMVIFSAAIKAVPAELLEAALIDGATRAQAFWRITVPQIAPTVGVVTTTLIVGVLRVFDIPNVMTNGNFDTQVLANEMWQRSFTQLNFGLGSAIAVVLFLGVLPVMYLNIRRMQKQRLG